MAPRIFTLTGRSWFDRRGRIGIHRVQRHPSMGQHRHEFFEIVVVLSGTATHVTGTYRHRLERGDVLVLNPQRGHGYEECRSLNIVNVLVRPEVLARLGRSLGDLPGYRELFRVESARWKRSQYGSRLRLSGPELERVEEWATRLEEENRRETRAVYVLQESCLTLMIDLLCRRFAREQGAGRERPEPSSRMDHLLSWIESHLDVPVKMAELARQAGLSLRSFYRAFQSRVGMTPQAYLARARMQRAAELLGDPACRLSVTEIALVCGFSDGNYFARCFRRAMGRTPTGYRRGVAGS